MTRRFVVRLAFALTASVAGLTGVGAQTSERFYVTGFVSRPGSYTHKANMTVGDALDAAGGFAPNRAATGIDITRKDSDGETQTMHVTLNDVVLPNDVVRVK